MRLLLRASRAVAAIMVVTAMGSASTQIENSTAAYQKLSVAQYSSHLASLVGWANDIQKNPAAADEAIHDLRGGWKIQANGQEFTVETGWLTAGFEKLKKNPADQDSRDEVLARLNALKTDAEDFQRVPQDPSSARAALSHILASREFRGVQGPTWWDRLKYRVLMWTVHLLDRAFGSSSAPVVGRIFVWTLVGLAVLAFAFYVYRALRQNARIESLVPQIAPVSAKNWHLWMQEAEAAASKGLWRDAVHLAYWAGISFLEQNGMWKPDQARTPREYLRLLPPASDRRPELSALTHMLEVTWYGAQAAGPETFSETVSLLERLGCRQA